MKYPYQEITNNIKIEVLPEFLDNNKDLNLDQLSWRYFINIKNDSNQEIKIISRYWKIINEDGSFEEISGQGIVGKQPSIKPELDFKYSSHVILNNNSSGIMMGYYIAQNKSGEKIRINIPKFSLDKPNSDIKVN